ncbi:MAG TPA: hypothetical protein VFF70_06250, partial [Anaerolineae bacterium]|nr:hypothetical protein [Anaerolineae bacterium]
IFARVRRKTRLAARRLRGIEQPYPDIADIMDDISNISPAQRAFMAIQSQALQAYVPRSYPGRVAVFRTRAQSLVCSFDPLMKWATLAGDRVDVRIVEGSHHNMLQEPYVRSLAVQLKNSLV